MARRLNKPTPISTPAPGPGHNAAAEEEANRIQLISVIAKLGAANDEIERAKGPLRAAQDVRKKIVGLGKAAGFTAKELEARLAEMTMPSREMAEQAAREHRHRRWLGILEPDQTSLLLGDQAPQEAKDETDWRMRGYRVGLQGRAAKLPEGIPPRMDQPFLAGHADGFTAYTAALEGRAPEPSVAEQAKADYVEDKPEVDVEAAARKLRNDPKFMERGPAEEPFEATEEELGAQAGRRQPEDQAEVV